MSSQFAFMVSYKLAGLSGRARSYAGNLSDLHL